MICDLESESEPKTCFLDRSSAMSLSSTPVTLVIKAPNQKIADQKIECTVDWTVRQLKQHLAKVYPTNPVRMLAHNLCYMGHWVLAKCSPFSNSYNPYWLCSGLWSFVDLEW